jgi:hypothetical protein
MRKPLRRVVPALLAVAVLSAGLVACFHRTYIDHRYCDTANPCLSSSSTPFCDSRGICVERPDGFVPDDMFDFDGPRPACTESKNCDVVQLPICDPTSMTCRECKGDPNGSGASPECAGISAARPLCAPNGACVACIVNRDCLTQNKTCHAGVCTSCETNADCASGICNAGTCADPMNITYVSASGKSCGAGSGGIGIGSLDDPFCKIQRGLDDGASRNHKVVIFAGNYAENIMIQPTGTYDVTAVGVGQPTITPASPGPAITIANSNQSVSVSLDGITVQNASGPSGSGVDCSSFGGAATTRFTLLRSTLRNNSATGIVSSKCDLTLDQVIVGPANLKGGISLDQTAFTITNTLIFRNGSTGGGSGVGGMRISGASTRAVVGNVTIVNNSNDPGVLEASGMHCSGASPMVFDTVIQGNSGMVQINATICKPDHSSFVHAADANTGSNNNELLGCSANLLFKDAANDNYHPATGGSGSCTLVNLGVQFTSAPTHDLDGNPRPAMGQYDIGAYELQ